MENQPWYQRARRWCQANLTEIDGRDCDVALWREFWRKNHIEGTIVNAGGTVAYYPSENPDQYRAAYLGSRDLLREFIDAAKEEGVAVMARMDTNQAPAFLLDRHPEWFMRDREGKPIPAGPRYLTCVNGGYYREHIPKVMEEIVRKYAPDVFGDNSWTGNQAAICYCENCKERFRRDTGLELPEKKDDNDPVYRKWLQWSIGLRTEIWDLYNQVTTRAGGPDCLWLGMVQPEFYPSGAIRQLYDDARLSRFTGRAHMVDSQGRSPATGFEQNLLQGLTMHQLYGEEALIIESVASYRRSNRTWRKAASAKTEMEAWMLTGIAGGISPSAHFIGGTQEDTRTLENGSDVMDWHRRNEDYLYHRALCANIGIAWSKENAVFYGREQPDVNCQQPYQGFVQACLRGRLGFFPVHAKDLEKASDKMDLLILPDLAVMSDEQIEAAVRLIQRGKSVIVSGNTGMLDEKGEPRARNLLEELFGIRRRALTEDSAPLSTGSGILGDFSKHSYLRLPPEGRPRHAILRGFEGTGILPFGGSCADLSSVRLEPAATYIPPFPIYPPEFSYMPDNARDSGRPVILAGETGFGGKAVWLAGDIDRAYGDSRASDLGDLLVNAMRWALDGKLPFTVEGPGRLACALYRRQDAYILHLVNLSGLNEWPAQPEMFYPVGPVTVRVDTGGRAAGQVRLTVAEKDASFTEEGSAVVCTIERIESHEMVVIKMKG